MPRMKVLMQWFLLTLLLIGRSAFATPTLVESPGIALNTSPLTITFTTSQAVGNVIECAAEVTGGATTSGLTVSDSLNGSYGSAIATALDTTNSVAYAHFWKVVTTSGTPTVTVTMSGRFIVAQCNAYTGFVGTPTVDSAMTQIWGPFAATTSFSFSPIVTAQNNEILSMFVGSGSFINSGTPTGWNASGGNWAGNYKIAASSGTSATFAGTLNVSSWIGGLSIGIYDAGPPPNANNSQFFLL